MLSYRKSKSCLESFVLTSFLFLTAANVAELLISKTLRRDGTATHKRLWSGAKTGKTSVVPLSKQVAKVLRYHRKTMQCLGLNTKDGLVFVAPRTYGHLFD